MADSFNPHLKYNDNDYNITGKALNQIGKEILDLRQEVKDLKDKDVHEELAGLRIRDKNPAVKDAWDKYQTVLSLARNN